MQNFTIHAYLIKCQTNLHVGSGDNNYGVIDKQVQRDSISLAPIIHASGIKGAFREYFDKSLRWGETTEGNEKLTILFGSDKTAKENLKQGSLRFFEAHLLSIPVRGKDNEPFYRATSCEIVNAFNSSATTLGMKDIMIILPTAQNTNAHTEYADSSLLGDIPYVGEKAVKMEHSMMNDEVFRHLPIIARNCLENGQSENLWYEEVVPRESCFYFFIAVPNNMDSIVNYDNDFNNNVHDRIIQIGANATVGYGYCKILKIA